MIAVFAGQTLVLTGVETRSGPNGRTELVLRDIDGDEISIRGDQGQLERVARTVTGFGFQTARAELEAGEAAGTLDATGVKRLKAIRDREAAWAKAKATADKAKAAKAAAPAS